MSLFVVRFAVGFVVRCILRLQVLVAAESLLSLECRGVIEVFCVHGPHVFSGCLGVFVDVCSQRVCSARGQIAVSSVEGGLVHMSPCYGGCASGLLLLVSWFADPQRGVGLC